MHASWLAGCILVVWVIGLAPGYGFIAQLKGHVLPLPYAETMSRSDVLPVKVRGARRSRDANGGGGALKRWLLVSRNVGERRGVVRGRRAVFYWL